MTTFFLQPDQFYHLGLNIVVLPGKVNALVIWTEAQGFEQCALADNIDPYVLLSETY